MNSADLLNLAGREGGILLPGSPFYACGGGQGTMRLNFSNATPKDPRGIARLGKVIKTNIRG